MIDIEKEGLVLLCEALDAVGDQYGVYAYSGQGRARIEFLTIKDFDDRLGAVTAHQQDTIPRPAVLEKNPWSLWLANQVWANAFNSCLKDPARLLW